jgi:hypothetical protein
MHTSKKIIRKGLNVIRHPQVQRYTFELQPRVRQCDAIRAYIA